MNRRAFVMILVTLLGSLVTLLGSLSFANGVACGTAVTSYPTEVISVEQITPSTLHIRVKKPEGFKANPGEAVKFTLQTANGEVGKMLSISSSTEASYLEFTVRISDSDFKKAMVQFKVGDKISLSAPKGFLKFYPDKPAVFIAGGIGITPFRSILQSMKDQGLDQRVTLLYANRAENEIAFKAEFDQLAQQQKNFKVQNIVGDARIDKDLLAQVIPQHPEDTVFYIIGPPPMVKAMKALLAEMGLPAERISVEMFAGYQ